MKPAKAALAAGKPALVWKRLVADTETPVGAALKLFEPERGDFLLESVEGGATRGRYSLIGLDPDLVYSAPTRKAVEINRAWQQRSRSAFAPLEASDSLTELRALVCRLPHRRVRKNCPPRLRAWSAISATRRSALVEKRCRALRKVHARAARHAVRPALADPGVRSAQRRIVLRGS